MKIARLPSSLTPMKATIGRLSPGRNWRRSTLLRSVRSPAGPTATETRNAYQPGFGLFCDPPEVELVPPEVLEVLEVLEVVGDVEPLLVETEDDVLVPSPVSDDVPPVEEPPCWVPVDWTGSRERKGFLLCSHSRRLW